MQVDHTEARLREVQEEVGEVLEAEGFDWQAVDATMVRMAGIGTIEAGGRLVDAASLDRVCRRFGVAELAIFGSVVRGDASPDSDIDILYQLIPGARLGFDLFDLEDALGDLFGRKVDLLSRASVHRLMRERVLAESVVVYAA